MPSPLSVCGAGQLLAAISWRWSQEQELPKGRLLLSHPDPTHSVTPDTWAPA